MLDPCLIVTIVRKGWGDTVLEATMNAGAHGGTILFGRGIGRNEQQRVFGIQIEPEKEIVLTVVPADLKEEILREVERAAEKALRSSCHSSRWSGSCISYRNRHRDPASRPTKNVSRFPGPPARRRAGLTRSVSPHCR